MTNYASPITIPHDTSIPGKFMIRIGVANQTNSGYSYEVDLHVQIDTGSCGIVIPATALYQKHESTAAISSTASATEDSATRETACTAAQLALTPLMPGVTTKYEPATIVYQPSGDSIIGFYYYIDELGIGSDEDGNPLVIAKNVKVMGATSGSPFMMGVGFDRPLIADNAFLANLTTANNNSTLLYPSYYLDHQTVQLGTNPSNSFGYQTLTVQTTGTEKYQNWNWNTPQGTVAVTSADSATLLSSTPVSWLIDTGLNLMMINNMGTLFPAPGTNSDWDTANIAIAINADSGSSSKFSFPLTGTAQAQLSPGKDIATTVYTTENSVVTNGDVALRDSGSVSTPAPTLVHVISNGNGCQVVGKPFINTGFNPLFAYGMIFDPANNRMGLKSLSSTR